MNVVDLADGRIIGTIGGMGTAPKVAMVTRNDDAPLVIVAAGSRTGCVDTFGGR